MEKKNYYKRLLLIAVPIMLSNIISQLQMIIDKIFLGRLDITCMSAVGNATSSMWTTMNTMFSLTVGATILISQAIGEGDDKKAQNITNSLFLYNNFLAIFWFVFWLFGSRFVFTLMGVSENIMGMTVDYAVYYAPVFLLCGLGASVSSVLQACEKTKIMVLYGVVRSGLNIVLDYALIFGHFGMPRMEVKGAALATTIAEYVGDVVILVYFIAAKDIPLKPKLKDVFVAKVRYYIDSIKLGIPTCLEDFAWNFGNLFLIAMLNQVSDSAAGIYSIVFSVECIPVVVFGALGNATLTLSGQETGKKEYSQIKSIVRNSMVMCISVATFILVMFICFPQTILSWFTSDESVIVASAVYLLIMGCNLFPKSANIIVGSGIRGYGDTKWMLLTQVFGTCFVVIASATLIMGLHLGMIAVFFVIISDETIRCAINYIKLRHVTARVTE